MALRVPAQQAQRWLGTTHGRRVALPPVRSKYRAVAVIVDGFRFASKAEARRYQQLVLRGLAGELRNLELQPRFDLHVHGVRVGCYIADFRYQERWLEPIASGWRHEEMWRDVTEDVKGVKTPVYKLKKRITEAEYGLTISEV